MQVKATPAIRAMAKQLNVDLTQISGTGPQHAITREDVQKAAVPQASKSLHGARRAMAKVMTEAHAQIVPVTIYDDANINNWIPGTDITVRTIRAIVKACQAEPALNAWYKNNEHQLHSHVNLGLAMDTTDGLFVPVLSEVDTLLTTPQKIREQVNHYKKVVEERSVKPAELQGATFTLSNFGMFAGRYANPIIVPPQVGILATGKIRDVVLAINGEPKVQRIMPLSLTFDHRAATGGEATRFLAAIMADLTLSE